MPLLVDHFLRDITANKHTAPHRVSPEVMRRFQAYRWPGNVRELRNALERMMILADNETMTENDLPSEILTGSEDITSAKEIPTGLTMDELERLAITKGWTLDQCGAIGPRATGWQFCQRSSGSSPMKGGQDDDVGRRIDSGLPAATTVP